MGKQYPVLQTCTSPRRAAKKELENFALIHRVSRQGWEVMQAELRLKAAIEKREAHIPYGMSLMMTSRKTQREMSSLLRTINVERAKLDCENARNLRYKRAARKCILSRRICDSIPCGVLVGPPTGPFGLPRLYMENIPPWTREVSASETLRSCSCA